jgi:hypothetical protein
MRFYNQLQIIGIIIVIILYFILPEKTPLVYENFTSTSDSIYKVIYPEPAEIEKVITSESYFKLFKELDFQVRDCPPVKSYCQKKYSRLSGSPTTDEQSKFTIFYQDIIENIPQQYRHHLLKPIIKIAKTYGIENKFPHTHSDIIFLDEMFFQRILSYQKGNIKMYLSDASTIIHEITHLLQREQPQKYDALYNSWKFQSLSYQHLNCNFPHHIIQRIRLNPDELPHYRFWVWDNKILPLVLYESSKAKNVNDVVYIGVRWDKPHDKIKAETDYLDRFSDYQDYFGITNNHYHPLEIQAEYQAVKFLEFIDQSISLKSPGYLQYKKFLI